MDVNFPSINIDLVNEIHELYDIMMHFKTEFEKFKEEIREHLETNNNNYSYLIKKVDIIHELFNKDRNIIHKDKNTGQVKLNAKLNYKRLYENAVVNINKRFNKVYSKIDLIEQKVFKKVNRGTNS